MERAIAFSLFWLFLPILSPSEFLECVDIEIPTGVNPGSITNSLGNVY